MRKISFSSQIGAFVEAVDNSFRLVFCPFLFVYSLLFSTSLSNKRAASVSFFALLTFVTSFVDTGVIVTVVVTVVVFVALCGWMLWSWSAGLG